MDKNRKSTITNFVTGSGLMFNRFSFVLINCLRVGGIGALASICLFYLIVHLFINSYDWYVWKKVFVAHFWALLFMPGFHLSFIQPNGQVLPVIRADQLLDLANYTPEISSGVLKVELLAGVSLLAGVVVTIALVRLGVLFGRKEQEDEFVRGQRVVTPDQLKKSIQDPSPMKIAEVPMEMHMLARNIGFFGSMGVGKSVCIDQLIEDARKWGKKMVIYDKTGAFTRKWFREGHDVLLNPVDARCASWSLFSDLRQITDPAMVSRFFVPENKQSSDPVWDNAARMLFEDLVRIVYEKKGTLEELKRLITKLDLETLHNILVKNDATSQATINPKNEKTSESVRFTLSSQPSVRFFDFFKDKTANFSIRDFMRREDDACLFLTSNATQHEAIRPFLSVWLELALTEIMSMPETRDVRCIFFLDELASLSKLNSLDMALTEARKFGIVSVVGLQNLAQSDEINGKEMTKVYVANLQTKLILRTEEEASAKRLADILGKEDVEENNESKSYGIELSRDGVNLGTRRTERHLVTSTEIMILPDLTGYLKLAGNYPIAKVEFPYKSRPDIAPAYVMREGLELVETSQNWEGEPIGDLPQSSSEAVMENKSHLY